MSYMAAAKLLPLEPYPGKGTLPWRSRCLQCGQEVSPSLSSVRNNGGGCRPCGLKKSAKTRSVNEDEAIEVMKAGGAIPQIPYPGANKPWPSVCVKCSKNISTQYGSVKAGRSACIYCAGKKIDPQDAMESMKKFGYAPLTKYPGSITPWESIHLICGEKVTPRFTALQMGRGGCVKCGYQATKEKQMGDHEVAKALMLKAGLEPLEEYPGANRPWRCKWLEIRGC